MVTHHDDEERSPYFFDSLPLPAALYGVLVFPFLWGVTEQMCDSSSRVTYCAPRPDSAGRKNALRLATLPRARRSGFDGGLRQAKSDDWVIP